jgi:hypothetical protein
MKAWPLAVLVTAGAACAPVFAACYTYNIVEYHAGTGTGAGTGGGGASGSSSDASVGTGVSACVNDSKGFELESDGGPCELAGTLSLTDSTAESACRYWRPNEPPPVWDPPGAAPEEGSVLIDTGCSEVTPYGLGPVLFRTIPEADLDTTDFAIWGTFEFDYGPEAPYSGAGLLIRSTTLGNNTPYAIMDIYEHMTGSANLAIWAPDQMGFGHAYGNKQTMSGSFDVRIGLCYTAMDKTVHGYEQRAGKFEPLQETFQPNFTGDVLLGFAAHAYDGGTGGRVTVRVKHGGWGVRPASSALCPGAMSFMPDG